MAGLITKHFWPYIRRYSDPFTLRLIGSVMKGRAPSLLDLDDRPDGYEDVGRLCTWDNLFPERVLPRSQYERVLIRAISGDKLHMDGEWYTPTGMRGWSRVIFRRKADNSRHIFSLDYLLDHRRWMAGPGLSLADFTAAAHFSVIDYLGALDWRGHKQTKDWYAVMKSRPCFRPLLGERMEVIVPPAHYDKVDF